MIALTATKYNSHLRTHITKRETQILQLVAHEHNTAEISRMLYISESTVISHRKNIMEKMLVRNAAGMVRAGFEMGLLKL